MWRLFHKLFGWDYVRVEFGFDYHIRRIKKTPNGVEYVNLYGMKFLSERHYQHLTRKPVEGD